MLEAAKAALDKAGFIIENLRNRVKELEAENAKLKEPNVCRGCVYAIYEPETDEYGYNHKTQECKDCYRSGWSDNHTPKAP